MVIKPRIKGFLCTTAHPQGCAIDVERQVSYVRDHGPIDGGPKKVLIIGASGGYGLATRVTAAFGSGASTVGVFFERPATDKRTASPGWYKSAAFDRQARQAGLYTRNFNGDAFSDGLKQQVASLIARDLGQVDMVVYSLAAPQRTMPDGTLVRSALKPIGKPFSGVTIDIVSGEIRPVSLEPASEQEIDDTVKVMGGGDWERWMSVLSDAGVLAPGCITTNYTYLGSEVTWPIYYHGTIGKAKEDLDRAAREIDSRLGSIGGTARVAVMKGLLTGASSAIPGMSLYLSLLFKVMKQAGTHEGCIEQTTRLFAERLFGDAASAAGTDEAGRIRMDDWELSDEVQALVAERWSKVNQDNLDTLTDFDGYRSAFMQLHGFGFDGVDYDADVDPEVPMDLVL
ncbi:MAG: trans-2-enoyl-CoA reductase family protein [Proteobacteria bacterium]|jgi:enoyl-[acyl-carrier protein] reductase / trans-2-enoyl-CoA reductase (NAD+)|nr:trans-2-enoyl-CoA reductase family protein [Pseudomonadota bacterium]MDA1299910.1 trans-2-enoyl-CoA reductase family protein [Pseudomonadota bacterium]